MPAGENKAIARTALEGVWSVAGTASPDQLYAANFVGHQPGQQNEADIGGIEALKEFIAEFHLAFPDLNDAVEFQIGEGDMVASAFTSSGTHKAS